MTRKKYINKPFSYMPSKDRAIFILLLGGFTYDEISVLLKTGRHRISRIIKTKTALTQPIYEGEDEKQ